MSKVIVAVPASEGIVIAGDSGRLESSIRTFPSIAVNESFGLACVGYQPEHVIREILKYWQLVDCFADPKELRRLSADRVAAWGAEMTAALDRWGLPDVQLQMLVMDASRPRDPQLAVLRIEDSKVVDTAFHDRDHPAVVAIGVGSAALAKDMGRALESLIGDEPTHIAAALMLLVGKALPEQTTGAISTTWLRPERYADSTEQVKVLEGMLVLPHSQTAHVAERVDAGDRAPGARMDGHPGLYL